LKSEPYTEADISPRFWPNGKIPEREDWKQMANDGFLDYKQCPARLLCLYAPDAASRHLRQKSASHAARSDEELFAIT
jgi:hypothetical protein